MKNKTLISFLMLLAVSLLSCSGKAADEHMDADADTADTDAVDTELPEEEPECVEDETRYVVCDNDPEKNQLEVCEDGIWTAQGDCSECGRKFPNEIKGECWSDRSEEKMTCYDARFYCDRIGGVMPNVDQLRTLLENCPSSETGGSCTVTESCSSEMECRNDNCNGCDVEMDGSHSLLGQAGTSWSNTANPDNIYYGWTVSFSSGLIVSEYMHEKNYVWCLKLSSE